MIMMKIPDDFEVSPEQVDAMYDSLAAAHQEAAYELEQAEAKLATWERHGVLITEDCGECEGRGFTDACEMEECQCGLVDDCLTCHGSGKVLRDGAVRHRSFVMRGNEAVTFPASWLEGSE